MTKLKHIPLRTCASCRIKKPKYELLRIIRDKDGVVKPDLTGKAQGRGVYLCRSLECFAAGHKKRCLNRAFSSNVDENAYKEIEELLSGQR